VRRHSVRMCCRPTGPVSPRVRDVWSLAVRVWWRHARGGVEAGLRGEEMSLGRRGGEKEFGPKWVKLAQLQDFPFSFYFPLTFPSLLIARIQI
jgi:hypothetical protein